MLNLIFRMPVKVEGQEHSLKEGAITSEADRRIDVSKIDAGSDGRYVFYVWNCCSYRFVKLSAPEYATVTGDGKDRKRVQLKQSLANFVVSMMPKELDAGGRKPD